ncbi:MAG: Molybdopterin-converting factor small subunit [Candidatus Tokpelaia hoelldobleri]|uniref:Molybdopterin-converting factor small subunit n=1 Tax=Candidatus Tokpelaia hoelldobleri TaxID=1902579 RepID=A0A1U9JUM4_9HYPH|nr:MAG: Molybdopterin-converting factor small subunit [Candidatus Tokpelaia hoelldoblerii]
MKFVYFARVREKIGKAEEDITLPEHIITVKDLLDFLRQRGDAYADALAMPELIRVAADQQHADLERNITGAREIALFPPMTGG